MRNSSSIDRFVLLAGLGAGLTGCVVESYPVPAANTRRVPTVEIPHPGVAAGRPPVDFAAGTTGMKPVAAADIPAADVADAQARKETPLPADASGGDAADAAVVTAGDEAAATRGPAAPERPTPRQTEAPSTPAAQTSGLSTDFLRFGELPVSSADVPMRGGPGGDASPTDNPSAVQRVTFADEGADSDVAPDPMGRFIVFASTRHRATSDLYLQRTGSAAVTQLTSDPSNDVMPVVSPDGKTLAFASDRGGTWDLYLTGLNGGPTVRLTDDGAQNLHPSFSADGKRLVYSSRAPRSGVWELVVIDLNNPSQRQLVGHGLFPTFSPTDDTIVYQRARERGGRWFSLWTMDLTGANPGPPTEIAASSNAALITPAWSPDGQQVVFCTVMQPTADSNAAPRAAAGEQAHGLASDVWVCDADGGRRSRLTRGGFAHLQPAWSAGQDGSGSIFFVSNRGTRGSENVYALSLTPTAERGGPGAVFEAGVPVRP